MSGYCLKRISRYRFEQPTTQHEKTRQTEENKNRIITHPGISKAEMADMRKNHENHRESSHRIDVFYPLLTHYGCKITEKSPKLWSLSQKILTLHKKREVGKTQKHGCQMQRINWIDWVKAWCMTVVVFCHLPQQEDTFYLQYLASVILSSFFFVSGYLTKPMISQKETLKKYGYSLLIPYLIYNAIYYPYWMVKYNLEHGGISFTDSLKPIFGTILLQLNTDFSCELNGVTWFLPALFLMHWITDVCNRQKHGKSIMLFLTIISIILYGANKCYHYAPFITYHGFIRCLCFFFMGNLFQQAGYLKNLSFQKDLLIGTSTLLLSLGLFYWHIHEDIFILHIILYYVVNFFSVFGIIYLCRSLDNLRLHIVTLISIGTMLIFGLHRILIGLIDFSIEKAFYLSDISYDWHEGIIIALTIEIILLPLVIWSQKRYPILLGKKPLYRK